MPIFKSSPLDVPPCPTGAQAALREQLASLEARAFEIRNRLNALTLPVMLPPEILAEIFLTHAARVQKEHLDNILSHKCQTGRVASYYKWIYVAHVCHRWREVALACAEWKAFAVFESWTVPNTMLYGSHPDPWGDFPLTFTYHQNWDATCDRCTTWYTDSTGIEYIQELLPDRMRHLTVIIEEMDGTRELWRSLEETPSRMETLRIGLRGEARHYHTSDRSSRLTMPDKLFASSTPRLRSLTTSDVSFSWASTLLCPTLRHLEVTGHPGHRPDTDMAEFIAALGALPLLETLVLDSLPEVRETGDLVRPLPRLKLLELSATMDGAAYLLSHLRLPPTTSISFAFDGADHSPRAVTALMGTLTALLKDTPIRTMSWMVPPIGSIGELLQECETSCIRAWGGTNASVDQLWMSKPDIAPRLTVTQNSVRHAMSFIRHLPLASLEELHVLGSCANDWTEAFADAPNVTLLRVTGRVGFRLGASLSRLLAPAGGIYCAPIYLPRVLSLEFSHVRFPPPNQLSDDRIMQSGCRCECCERDDGRWRKRGIDVKDLVRGLRRRRAMGAQEIQRVDFMGCPYMKRSHTRALLREGITVGFDGVVLEHDVGNPRKEGL